MDLDKQLDRILYECVVVDRVRAKAAIKKLIDEAVLAELQQIKNALEADTRSGMRTNSVPIAIIDVKIYKVKKGME